MREKEEQRVWYSLYGRLLDERALKAAFAKVKKAKGAPGIDGRTIADFAKAEELEIARLLQELRENSYRHLPVRRVMTPKPDGGERALGIPAVRDRVVQQALLSILEPVFEPHFHPSSYAYRPGRSCHDAIAKVAMFTRTYDLTWVVDLDLSKCFDTLDHDLILECFRKRIVEGTASSAMRMTSWCSRTSKSGATNALRQAKAILEDRLKLKVNEEKFAIRTLGQGIPYLGVVIRSRVISIQKDRLNRFKAKVKTITRRNSPVNLEKVSHDNELYEAPEFRDNVVQLFPDDNFSQVPPGW